MINFPSAGVKTTHAGITLLVIGIYTAVFSVALHLWRVHLVKRGRELWYSLLRLDFDYVSQISQRHAAPTHAVLSLLLSLS